MSLSSEEMTFAAPMRATCIAHRDVLQRAREPRAIEAIDSMGACC